MRSITIKIKPGLINMALDSVLARYRDGINTEEERARAYFAVMEAIEQLEARILKYFRIIKEALMDRGWTSEFLEDIGEKILEYALENASEGYVGVPKGKTKTGGDQAAYKKRESIVEELYMARFGRVPEGLTSGGDHLLNSLQMYDQHNIFEVKAPNKGATPSVTVGTKWIHAKQIEEGTYNAKRGIHNLAWHLGMSNNPENSIEDPIPAKWLIDEKGYEIAKEMVDELAELIKKEEKFEPRPFLKPALWYVRFGKEYITMLIDAILYKIQSDITQLSGIGMQSDTFSYRRGIVS